MKNITISLPDSLAHKAKVFAAEQNTSVSRYVGSLLSERLEKIQGYEFAMSDWNLRKPTQLNESGTNYPKRGDLYER